MAAGPFTWADKVNQKTSTITGSMTDVSPGNAGTFSVASATGWPSKGYLLIDSEILQYASISGTTITLASSGARGAGGTTAAAHVINSVIYADVIVAENFNELKANSPGALFTEQGDILYASAAYTPAALAHGTAGQVLVTGGNAANPSWSSSPNLNSIVFPVTQVASADANTLDDYEEGAWTPGLYFGGANVGITYSAQSGAYTKIGNAVFITLKIVLTSKGSSSGSASIAGLPFTSKDVFIGLAADTYHANMPSSVTYTHRVEPNSTSIILGKIGTTTAALTEADFNDNSHLYISGIYLV